MRVDFDPPLDRVRLLAERSRRSPAGEDPPATRVPVRKANHDDGLATGRQIGQQAPRSDLRPRTLAWGVAQPGRPEPTPFEPTLFEPALSRPALPDADSRTPEPVAWHALERRPIRIRGRELECGPALRGEEQKMLAQLGRFRVIAVSDLARTVYGGDERALRGDLRYLERKSLVAIARANLRRDRLWTRVRQMEVGTLRPPAARMLRQSGIVLPHEPIYVGLVKPAQVEHDSLIYPAYLKEIERIAALGARNPRLRLDFEIAGAVSRAIHEERTADPERGLAAIKRQIASEFNLPYTDGRILIPDARIDYDLEPDSRSGSSDIEVVTGAYGSASLRAKAEAGFRLYASAGDCARLGAEIEDSRQTLHAIQQL